MRILPYFVGAAVVVAIGGAVAGGAIDTTPRQIHDSPPVPAGSGIAHDRSGPRSLTANHYPLETDGETVEVAELRERGLYSQDRYGGTYYADDFDMREEPFDFAAAEADQRRWEAEQQGTQSPRATDYRPTPKRAPDRDRQTETAQSGVEFVSRPVVQDTSGMAGR